MRTDRIDELKKIELDIYDNEYEKELNSFLSVKLDFRNYLTYYELTDEQKRKILKTFYTNLLKDFNINHEDINNSINENYNFNEYDETVLKLIVPDITDNLLFIDGNLLLKKLKYICLKTPRDNVIANNITGFLSLNLDNFDDFFKFFLTFLCEFIDKIPKEYQNEIIKNQIPDVSMENVIKTFDGDIAPIDINMLKKCAKSIYENEINHVKDMQKLFRNFVDYIFNTEKDKKLSQFSVRQRFFVYKTICKDLQPIMENYEFDYKLDYTFESSYFTHDVLMSIHNNPDFSPLDSEDFLLDCIKKYDANGDNIVATNTHFTTDSIYTYFYLIIYFLTLSNFGYIQKCHYCGRYFYTNKINNVYCDRVYKDGTSCKILGSKLSQKRKEKDNPIYRKYRNIYAKKAMNVKRNPDIASYKDKYEEWKKVAKQFIKDIQSGVKTYEEFDKWLDKNK